MAAKKKAKKVVKKTSSLKKKVSAKKKSTPKVKKAIAKKKPAVKAKTAQVKKPVKSVSKSAAKKTKATAKVKKPTQKAKVLQKAVTTTKTEKKPILDLSNFMTPLDDRIVVQVSEVERRTPGGLYIPDNVADTSGNLHARVVAVGRGHLTPKGHLKPMDVKVGDLVVFAEYVGSKIKIQNQDLIVLREAEVMGVVTK